MTHHDVSLGQRWVLIRTRTACRGQRIVVAGGLVQVERHIGLFTQLLIHHESEHVRHDGERFEEDPIAFIVEKSKKPEALTPEEKNYIAMLSVKHWGDSLKNKKL